MCGYTQLATKLQTKTTTTAPTAASAVNAATAKTRRSDTKDDEEQTSSKKTSLMEKKTQSTPTQQENSELGSTYDAATRDPKNAPVSAPIVEKPIEYAPPDYSLVPPKDANPIQGSAFQRAAAKVQAEDNAKANPVQTVKSIKEQAEIKGLKEKKTQADREAGVYIGARNLLGARALTDEEERLRAERAKANRNTKSTLLGG